MVLRNPAERMPVGEPVRGEILVIAQVFQGEPEIVRVFHHGQEIGRLLQADLPVGRLAGQLLDLLEHRVEDGPGEVRLGVGQAGLIVRASSLRQCQEPLALKVREVRGPLPVRAVLDKESRQHPGERNVFNYQRLTLF
jgi:hypothetical protein